MTRQGVDDTRACWSSVPAPPRARRVPPPRSASQARRTPPTHAWLETPSLSTPQPSSAEASVAVAAAAAAVAVAVAAAVAVAVAGERRAPRKVFGGPRPA